MLHLNVHMCSLCITGKVMLENGVTFPRTEVRAGCGPACVC